METNDFLIRRLPSNVRPVVVLFGAVLIQFSIGIMYTFGNMLPYIRSYMCWKINPDQTTASLLWIQACMTSPPLSMLLGGYFERTIGGRKGAIIGLALYLSGIALSYFTIKRSFILFLITFGLMNGYGQGISYNAILVVVHKWMPEHVGLATGLVLAGFGCHGFVFAPLQTKFINPMGYTIDKDKGIFTQEDLLERIPNVFLLLGAIFAVLQTLGLLLLGEVVRPQVKEDKEETPGQQTPKAKKEDTLKDNICSMTFFILVCTLLCNATWSQTTNGLYKAYGQQFIKSDFFLSTVVSVSAIANCFGRIFWGRMADMTSYQVSMCTVSAIGSFLMWTLGVIKMINSPVLFMLWISLMFSCIGGMFTLVPYAANKCFGAERVGLTYGFIQISVGGAGILASLISTLSLRFLSYEGLFIIVGFVFFTSFILTSQIQFTKYGKPRVKKAISKTHTETDETV